MHDLIMFNLPNLITLIRIPCALIFLQGNPVIRAIALLIAMGSDCLDGYVARRYSKVSRFGTFLDPMVDKIFVFFVLEILLEEGQIAPWQVASMLCRDVAIIVFGGYLILRGKFGKYQFRSIWFGKVTTALQFVVILALTLNLYISPFFFVTFIILGPLALCELYFDKIRIRLTP